MTSVRRRTSQSAPSGYFSQLVLGAGVIAYAYVLHDAYARLIAPSFSYLGQTYRTPSAGSILLSTTCVLLMALTLPRRVESLPDFVLWVLFLIAVAPSVLIGQYADVLTRADATSAAVAMTACFLAVCVGARTIRMNVTLRVRVAPQLLQFFALSFSVLMLGYLIGSGAATSDLVGLTEVQDVRSTYKSMVDTIPLLGYAIQFQTAVLNPIFMTVGVVRKRPAVLLFGIVGQIAIYSVTGYKLTVLSPIFVVALALALSKRPSVPGNLLTLWMTGAMVLASMLDLLTRSHLFVTVFVNRLVATPGVLTSAYYRVFQDQPKYYWAHSFMSPFISSPYDSSPGYVVGTVYQHADTQSNASFLADGYANAGWAGVVIEGAFILVVLALLNAAGRGIPLALTAPSSLVAALGLANNSPFSSVLTGGFGGLILAFAMWPRPHKELSPSHGSVKERRPSSLLPSRPHG